VVGGVLTEGRGVVVPGMRTSGPFITDALRDSISFAVRQRPDFLALSFVRNADDVAAVRAVLREHDGDIPIVAKIERGVAVGSFDGILAISDGIMVARGDLGVDIPLEKVPLVQKKIITKSNKAGKPVITATQMLESMVGAARPTRAEVTDVANAIFDGTDAVMLSAETSIGKYPVQAVRMMAKIARETEGYTAVRSDACGERQVAGAEDGRIDKLQRLLYRARPEGSGPGGLHRVRQYHGTGVQIPSQGAHPGADS
jgi:pyruvate kinase